MSFRHGDESASPIKPLDLTLTAVPLAIKVRALPQHSIVIGALTLSLFLLAVLGAASPARALVEGEDFEPGQVIVKLNPTTDATIEMIKADYGLTSLEKLPGYTGIYLLKVPAGSDTEGVVSRLANDTRLLYAEPNFVAEAPE